MLGASRDHLLIEIVEEPVRSCTGRSVPPFLVRLLAHSGPEPVDGQIAAWFLDEGVILELDTNICDAQTELRGEFSHAGAAGRIFSGGSLIQSVELGTWKATQVYVDALGVAPNKR